LKDNLAQFFKNNILALGRLSDVLALPSRV